MATKAKRSKAKSRLNSRAKRKARSIPLSAGTAVVRKSESAAHAPPANALDLAVAMFGFIQRATFTYAEFPARLVQCRSPMDVWREQARLTQRIFSGTST
jgi:hypothetical protein